MVMPLNLLDLVTSCLSEQRNALEIETVSDGLSSSERKHVEEAIEHIDIAKSHLRLAMANYANRNVSSRLLKD